MELRVSLDEREDPDEEQEIEVEGIPFVVNEDVIDSYGLKYTIATRRQIRRRPLLLVADRDFFELRGQAHTFYTAQDERVIPSVPHPTHEYNATDTKGGSPDESREPGRSRENL